jgi:hypothetical protein
VTHGATDLPEAEQGLPPCGIALSDGLGPNLENVMKVEFTKDWCMNMAKIEARAAELHEGCQMPMEQARELAASEMSESRKALLAAFGAAAAAREQDLRGQYPKAARVLAEEVFSLRAALRQKCAEYDDMKSLLEARKGLAEWRTLALSLQAQVNHQADCRESELVTLLKDILHCSDVFATFRPDLHARLLDFGRRSPATTSRTTTRYERRTEQGRATARAASVAARECAASPAALDGGMDRGAVRRRPAVQDGDTVDRSGDGESLQAAPAEGVSMRAHSWSA